MIARTVSPPLVYSLSLGASTAPDNTIHDITKVIIMYMETSKRKKKKMEKRAKEIGALL